MRDYLIRLTAASVLAALIRRSAPDSGGGKAARFGAGLLVLITALSPLGNLDVPAAVAGIVQRGYGDVLTTVPVDRGANTLMEELIRDTSESYILDKAQTMGVELVVQVQTEQSSGYPIPWAVVLEGKWSQESRALLSRWIEDSMGIPGERQEWRET